MFFEVSDLDTYFLQYGLVVTKMHPGDWAIFPSSFACRMGSVEGSPGRMSSRQADGKVSPILLLMAEILHQLRLVVYPIVFGVSYIPGGAGFQPSTVGGGFKYFFMFTLGEMIQFEYIICFNGVVQPPTSIFVCFD